jgi:hypothetical protein
MLWAHTMLETPGMQYAMWAHNHSLEPQHVSDHNLFGIQSSLVGAVAVTIAMILNLLLVAGVASMLVDGGEQGSASKPRPGAQIS